MWRASVLTIFPEMFPGPLGASLAGKAREKGIWALEPVDLREFATDKHRTVDDTPAGGGPGMVMKADVIARAIDKVADDARPRLLMSPRGAPLTRARRHGADRRLRAPPARGHGQGSLRGRRELCGRPARISPVYPAGDLGGSADPGGSRLGRPRQGRGLAAERGREADPRAAARSVGRPRQEMTGFRPSWPSCRG